MNTSLTKKKQDLQALRARADAAMKSKRTPRPSGRGQARRVVNHADGPGSILSQRLKAWGVAGCSACASTAREMDKMGPEKCLERIDYLVEEIRPRAERWLRGKRFRSALTSALSIAGLDKMATEKAIRLMLEHAIRESQKRRSLRSVDVLQVIAEGVFHWRDAQTGLSSVLGGAGMSSVVQSYGSVDGVSEAVQEFLPKVCLARAMPFPPEEFGKLAQKHPGVQFVVCCHSVPSHLTKWSGILPRFTGYLKLSRDMENVWLATPDERVQWKYWTPRGLWLPNTLGDVPRGHDRGIEGPVNVSLVGRPDLIKSFPNQVFAVALANKTRKCRLHLMIHGATGRGKQTDGDLGSLAKSLGVETLSHPHMDHEAHRNRIANVVDIGMQAGFCESFNYVALEHMASGKPVVGSPTVRFLPDRMQVDPNDIEGMARKLLELSERLDADPEGEREYCREHAAFVADGLAEQLVNTLQMLKSPDGRDRAAARPPRLEHSRNDKVKGMREILSRPHATRPRVVVETGTLRGEFAVRLVELFDTVHTIERSRELYDSRPEGYGIRFHIGDSRDVLERLVQEIDDPCLFYLDAHWYPAKTDPVAGAGDHPLMEELSILSERDHADIVVVDDVHAFGRDDEGEDWSGWSDISPESLARQLGRVSRQETIGDMHSMWRTER